MDNFFPCAVKLSFLDTKGCENAPFFFLEFLQFVNSYMTKKKIFLEDRYR